MNRYSVRKHPWYSPFLMACLGRNVLKWNERDWVDNELIFSPISHSTPTTILLYPNKFLPEKKNMGFQTSKSSFLLLWISSRREVDESPECYCCYGLFTPKATTCMHACTILATSWKYTFSLTKGERIGWDRGDCLAFMRSADHVKQPLGVNIFPLVLGTWKSCFI